MISYYVILYSAQSLGFLPRLLVGRASRVTRFCELAGDRCVHAAAHRPIIRPVFLHRGRAGEISRTAPRKTRAKYSMLYTVLHYSNMLYHSTVSYMLYVIVYSKL